MHTSYWHEYRGGLRRSGTFVERAKSLIDHLNAYNIGEGLPPGKFTNGTWGMHFYDSMIVLERGRRPVVEALRTGGEQPST